MAAWAGVMVELWREVNGSGVYFGDRPDLMDWCEGIKEKEDV